jgi:hypothetical protein
MDWEHKSVTNLGLRSLLPKEKGRGAHSYLPQQKVIFISTDKRLFMWSNNIEL